MTAGEHINDLGPRVKERTQDLSSSHPSTTDVKRTVEHTITSETKTSTNEFRILSNVTPLPGAQVLNLDPNRLVATDENKQLVSVDNLTVWIVGSIDNGDGKVTLPSPSGSHAALDDLDFVASGHYGIVDCGLSI